MGQTSDEQAVRHIETMWDEAWNRHDAAGLAELLVEDVDFVNVTGAWFKGRAQFKERMAKTHQGIFKNSQRRTLETRVKFLSPEIAVVHARWEMSGLSSPDGSSLKPWQGIITRVVKKWGDTWKVVAAHNVDVADASGVTSFPTGL